MPFDSEAEKTMLAIVGLSRPPQESLTFEVCKKSNEHTLLLCNLSIAFAQQDAKKLDDWARLIWDYHMQP